MAGFELTSIHGLQPSPTNPRKRFDEAALQELAASIREHGILQPIVVREAMAVEGEPETFHYEIVAGERRYRAALMAEVEQVPVLIRDLTDDQVLEIQVIENAQRVDVHPLEESDAFANLIRTGHYDPASIAEKIGKTAAYVASRLMLGKLIPEARKELEEDFIKIGHAVELAKLDEDDQKDALKELTSSWNGRLPQPMSIGEFRKWVRSRASVLLSQARFDPDDADLYKKAGACGACPFNSKGGMIDLEPESPAVCHRTSCFRTKTEIHGRNQLAKAIEENPKALKVGNHWETKKNGVLARDILNNATREPSSGRVPVVVAEETSVWTAKEGHQRFYPGEILYVSKKALNESNGHSERREAESSKEREEEAKAERLSIEAKAIYEGSLDLLGKLDLALVDLSPVAPILRVIAKGLAHRNANLVKSFFPKDAKRDQIEEVIDGMATAEMLKLIVVWLFKDSLTVTRWQVRDGADPDILLRLRPLAKALNLDVDLVIAEAVEAKEKAAAKKAAAAQKRAEKKAKAEAV